MLTLSRDFLFPNLVICKHAAKKNNAGIFKLDWSKKEYHNHETPIYSDPHNPELCDTSYYPSLPHEIDEEVKGLRFSLNSEYKTEIEYQSMTALQEWTKHRRFDTMIREMCLGPAIANIWVAFGLLADCVVDENGKWDRSPNRFWYRHALVYKFWFNQTGRGLIWRNARIDQLEDRFLNSNFDVEDSITESVRSFIEAIDNHLKMYEDVVEIRRVAKGIELPTNDGDTGPVVSE